MWKCRGGCLPDNSDILLWVFIMTYICNVIPPYSSQFDMKCSHTFSTSYLFFSQVLSKAGCTGAAVECQDPGVKRPAEEQAVDKPAKKKLTGKRETPQSSLNAVLDKIERRRAVSMEARSKQHEEKMEKLGRLTSVLERLADKL